MSETELNTLIQKWDVDLELDGLHKCLVKTNCTELVDTSVKIRKYVRLYLKDKNKKHLETIKELFEELDQIKYDIIHICSKGKNKL